MKQTKCHYNASSGALRVAIAAVTPGCKMDISNEKNKFLR
jgi:hypothetical protein